MKAPPCGGTTRPIPQTAKIANLSIEAFLDVLRISGVAVVDYPQIDELCGRTAARAEGVRLFGTGALLVKAKEKHLISSVRTELDALQEAGYRLSKALRAEIMRLAGE